MHESPNKNEKTQSFEGQILEKRIAHGPDILLINQLEAELGPNGRIIIPGDQPPNPTFGQVRGQSILATIKSPNIGGDTPGPQMPDTLLLTRLDDPDEETKFNFPGAKQNDFVLYLTREGIQIVAGTLVNEAVQMGLVRRGSNLTWTKYGVGGGPGVEALDVPNFDLVITHLGEGIGLINHADTPVQVTTRALPEHKAVLGV